MADRALRGMRMGSNSLESEDGVVFVERQDVGYSCPFGHEFEVPFAIDAEVPDAWDCPTCSALSIRTGIEDFQDEKPNKPTRSHWDMLLERRSEEELEQLLQERLQEVKDQYAL